MAAKVIELRKIDCAEMTWGQMAAIVVAIRKESKRRNPIGINSYTPYLEQAEKALLEISAAERAHPTSEAVRSIHWIPRRGSLNTLCGRTQYIVGSDTNDKARVTCPQCLKLMRAHRHLVRKEPSVPLKCRDCKKHPAVEDGLCRGCIDEFFEHVSFLAF